MSVLPSIFVSHGAPTIVFSNSPARSFLEGLGRELQRPKAVLMISAHWIADTSWITTAPAPETIHDFYGFPQKMYELSYPAKTDAGLIARVGELMKGAGLPYQEDPERGFDHGAWTPMMLSYPKADIPMVQMALKYLGSAKDHFEIGQALAPLRQEGVLVLGSGSSVHNLRERSDPRGPAPDWAQGFDDWLQDKLLARDLESLLKFPEEPESAMRAHPTDEHLMPLYVAMGAGWDGGATEVLHRSFTFGSLGMSAFSFGNA